MTVIAAPLVAGGFPIVENGGRTVTSLSGPGWTCDGEEVRIPHIWNAVDGADGIGPKCEDSASAQSYLRKASRYRRNLPDPEPGRRPFLRFEGVSDKATAIVNGREAGCHIGAFTAFCCEVTDFLRRSGSREYEKGWEVV